MSEMLDILDGHYNREELRELCFKLKVDYDNLGGEGKRDKARELIDYMRRNGRTQELIETMKAERPNIDIEREVDSQYPSDTEFPDDESEDNEVGRLTKVIKIFLVLLAFGATAFLSMNYLDRYGNTEAKNSDAIEENNTEIIETAVIPPVLVGDRLDEYGNLRSIYPEIILDAQESLNYSLKTGDTSNLGRYFAGNALEENLAFVDAWHQSRDCHLQLEPEKDIEYFTGTEQGKTVKGSGTQTIHRIYYCNGESASRGHPIGPTTNYSLEKIDDIWYIIEQPAWKNGLLPLSVSEIVMDLFNFESDEEIDDWIGNQEENISTVGLSSQQVFSGQNSLAITTSGTLNGNYVFAEWHMPLKGSSLIGRIYWPEQNGVQITWAQICILGMGNCTNIPVLNNQWGVFNIDLYNMDGIVSESLGVDGISGIFLQAGINMEQDSEPYTFYIDGLELYPLP